MMKISELRQISLGLSACLFLCSCDSKDPALEEETTKLKQENIIGRMGELDQAEVEFLRNEFSTPLDLQGFVRQVPRELGPQIYALSVMTVRVDTREEATYLQQLAQGLGLDRQTVGSIHQQMGLS